MTSAAKREFSVRRVTPLQRVAPGGGLAEHRRQHRQQDQADRHCDHQLDQREADGLLAQARGQDEAATMRDSGCRCAAASSPAAASLRCHRGRSRSRRERSSDRRTVASAARPPPSKVSVAGALANPICAPSASRERSTWLPVKTCQPPAPVGVDRLHGDARPNATGYERLHGRAVRADDVFAVARNRDRREYRDDP